MLQIAQGSYKAAVTSGEVPEPSGIGSRELLARRLQLANQNTSQWNVLRRNLFVIYPGLQEKTDQLTYARNSQTWPAKQPAQTNTIEPEDIIIIIWDNSKYRVHCAIWRTMILIEPFNQSHKQNCDLEQISTAYIYFIAMLGTIRVLNSAASKTVFYIRRRSGPVLSRQGKELDLLLFLY